LIGAGYLEDAIARTITVLDAEHDGTDDQG
jgi:hypothetical protein